MPDDNTLERLETAMAEARELVREVHGVTKDLRKTIDEARRLITDQARDIIQTETKAAAIYHGTKLAHAVKTAEQRIYSRFDKIAELLLNEKKKQAQRLDNYIEDRLRPNPNRKTHHGPQ